MDNIKLWFARNFTFKGAALFVVWIAKVIPDVFGRTDFWAKNGGFLWHTAYDHATLSITLLCALLIWLDHRRVLKKLHGAGEDPHSLKGRAIKLRERIVKYVEERPKPVHDPQKGYMEGVQWSERLTCGFDLHFRDEAERLYLEFGELGLLPGIGWMVPEHVNTLDKINEIVDELGKLAGVADERKL